MRHDSHSHGPVDDPNFVNDRGYETRDFEFGSVMKALFFLFVFVGASSVITLVIYNIMVPQNEARTMVYPPPRVQALPPEPRLQANPSLDIKSFREQEAAAVTGYGVDPTTHEIRIPVDRAIDIVAQEGLPTRPDPGQSNPQEPNEPSYTEGGAPTAGTAGQGASNPPHEVDPVPGGNATPVQPAPQRAGTPATTQPTTGGNPTDTGTPPPPGGSGTGAGAVR
jgi:hypothetical protein